MTQSPKVTITAQDRSILTNTPVAGIVVVQGVTNRGRTARPIFAGSPLQFRRKLGGKRTDDRFSTYCLRMLEGGVKLWVIRAFHYTDVTDAATVEGTAATITIPNPIVTDGSTWQAESVGDGYNGTVITIADAASGTAGLKDITIELPESDTTSTLTDVVTAPDAAQIEEINNRLFAIDAGVVLVSISGAGFENGSESLAGGVQLIANIVDTDYTGDVGGGTGWHVVDSVTDAFRAVQIGVEDPDVDEGLRAYIVQRGDMRYGIPTPLGLNASGMLAYRLGTAPYTHVAHDTFYGSLVGGDISITDADTGETFDIPGLVDYTIIQSRKDTNQNPWISGAGPKRGRTPMPNNGVPYNLASGALQAEYDQIYPAGVNAMVYDAQFQTVYWGNKSLLRDVTQLSNKENVADLIVYIIRAFRPIIRTVLFDPNDPVSWKELFRRVRPQIQILERGRAIRPGEDEFWFWQGDQNADTISDAEFNTEADLSNGIYRARFVFVPIVAMEFIAIEVVATDSNSVNFVVQENVVV